MPDKETVAMPSENLRRIREVFESAAAQENGCREALLDRECTNDAELRSTVERMLAESLREHPILDRPLTLESGRNLLRPATLEKGARFGDYEIVREIGAGGMGAVYLARAWKTAEQEFYALKIIRSRSQEVSRRFLREQAILKTLQHPNIARLVDSGSTDENDPYFVMEYVEGVRIDQYCENHRLSIKGRLSLFRQLCSAVQYLHQNLIVHRDLKPSNVLVKEDGTLKLVDFGIAKLLQLSDSLPPINATIGLMTPDYASPEQICGGALSTLTDVYSLGVVLYELLAGVKPYASDHNSLHETIRRICEEEPRRPSAAMARAGAKPKAAKELRGELDNIVLKAIRKEPDRRYASVEQMDEDLRRYLLELPVLAQGDSLRYRMSKFLQRYKTAVAVTGLAAVLLVGGIVATGNEARIAQSERLRAEVHAKEAEQAKAIAENQTRIAQQERIHAEQATIEAQKEKGNAERRLEELQQLAQGAVRVYSETHERLGSVDASVIAQNTHKSLELLQNEVPLGRDYTQMFQSTAPSESPNILWHVPQGWHANEQIAGEFFVGVDHRVVHHGKSSLFVHSIVSKPKGGLYIYQNFDAKPFRGKRVELIGYIKSKHLHQLNLDLSTSKNEERATSDDISVIGTMQWKKYHIVTDVPSDAEMIAIDFYMPGAGSFWVDQLSFRVADPKTPLTEPTDPQDLDFTQAQFH